MACEDEQLERDTAEMSAVHDGLLALYSVYSILSRGWGGPLKSRERSEREVEKWADERRRGSRGSACGMEMLCCNPNWESKREVGEGGM